MGEQDAAIFHRYAEYLWRQAGGVVVRRTLAGALLGAALGAVMLTPWANWPLSHGKVYLLMVLGAVSGGFLGRSSGAARALGLRLQAELAQHQLQFQRYALAQGQAAAPEPAAPPSFVPAGSPPVSAAEPPAAASEPAEAGEAAPEEPAAIEAAATGEPAAATDLATAGEPVPADRKRPSYGWKAIEPADA